MLLRNKKAAKRTITFLVVGLVFAIFAPSAFAECGPGFSSKSQLIQVIKHNPGIAHGMRKELLAEPRSEYQADETVVNYVRQSNQKVFNAPSGYMLTSNTWCPGGYGDYQPYSGLLENMGGKPMLWHCDKEGKNCIPLLKGYCMNFVHGPPVKKHHPPKHHPHKCGCKKHHKKPKPKPPICESQGLVGTAGNCVSQSNNAKQECEAKVNGQWNGSQCTIVQINANCSNVAGNEGGTVIQGGNCNTVIVEEHPCGCEPKPEPTIRITGKTELNMIPAVKPSGDFYINVYASESGGTLTVDPGIGGVSSCSSSTPESSFTTSVPSGASKECVILYAPEDADKPASMTVTMTACLGPVCDTAEETVPLTYPTRP